MKPQEHSPDDSTDELQEHWLDTADINCEKNCIVPLIHISSSDVTGCNLEMQGNLNFLPIIPEACKKILLTLNFLIDDFDLEHKSKSGRSQDDITVKNPVPWNGTGIQRISLPVNNSKKQTGNDRDGNR
jgi:hypothetical protein